jgi:hypothetical protein
MCRRLTLRLRNRHTLLERRYGRTIVPAPVRKNLPRYNFESNLTRSKWLPECRRGLRPSEMEVAKLELTVQSLVVEK